VGADPLRNVQERLQQTHRRLQPSGEPPEAQGTRHKVGMHTHWLCIMLFAFRRARQLDSGEAATKLLLI
jgi:hypothetical protein